MNGKVSGGLGYEYKEPDEAKCPHCDGNLPSVLFTAGKSTRSHEPLECIREILGNLLNYLYQNRSNTP